MFSLKLRRVLLGSLPPFWRYLPVYLIIFATLAGLYVVWTRYVGVIALDATGRPSTAPVLFAGVGVAAFAIFANAWSQWQTSRISHALQGLQTLRTDREYLINANMVRRTIADAADSEWGRPLGPSMKAAFNDDTFGLSVDAPTFREASLFMLNQYEFLAAATRSGAVDLTLMEQTMAGPIRMLLTTYSEEIVALRRNNPKAFTNLIWLHRTISGSLKPYLGPLNAGD